MQAADSLGADGGASAQASAGKMFVGRSGQRMVARPTHRCWAPFSLSRGSLGESLVRTMTPPKASQGRQRASQRLEERHCRSHELVGKKLPAKARARTAVNASLLQLV